MRYLGSFAVILTALLGENDLAEFYRRIERDFVLEGFVAVATGDNVCDFALTQSVPPNLYGLRVHRFGVRRSGIFRTEAAVGIPGKKFRSLTFLRTHT